VRVFGMAVPISLTAGGLTSRLLPKPGRIFERPADRHAALVVRHVLGVAGLRWSKAIRVERMGVPRPRVARPEKAVPCREVLIAPAADFLERLVVASVLDLAREDEVGDHFVGDLEARRFFRRCHNVSRGVNWHEADLSAQAHYPALARAPWLETS
jgi:hypothetical protein